MNELVKVSGVNQDVAQRLRALYVAAGNDLREQDVLNDARSKKSPLHSYFEWDDSKAAEAHRLEQAAALIRRVKVEVIVAEDKPPIKVRAYISRSELAASATPSEPGSYVAIEQIAGQTAHEAQLRESMQRDLERMRRKYTNTDMFLELAQEVFAA